MKKPFFSSLFGSAPDGSALVQAETGTSWPGALLGGLDMADPLAALGELTSFLEIACSPDGSKILGGIKAADHTERGDLTDDAWARLLLAVDDRACECIVAIERGLFAHVAAETASEPRRLALLKYHERFGASAIASLTGTRSVQRPGGPNSRPMGAIAGPLGLANMPIGSLATMPIGNLVKLASGATSPEPAEEPLAPRHRPPKIDQGRVLLLVNRALLSFYGRQKMLALAHREIPGPFWSEVVKLRRVAAAHGISRTECAPYAQLPLRASAARLIALLIAFNAAPRDVLRPNEMQALDRLLRHWFDAGLFDIAESAGNAQTAYFFGAGMRGPHRVMPAMQPPGDGVMYVDLDEAHTRALDLGERARETRALPSELGPAACPIDAWIHLFEALTNQWSPNPPSRQSERRAHVGEMRVAPGFAMAVRLIALSAQARAVVQAQLGGPVQDVPAYPVPGLFSPPPLAGMPGGLGMPASAMQAAALPGSANLAASAHLPGATLRAVQQLEQRENLPGIVKWQYLDHSATGFAVILNTPADWAHPGRVVTYRRENDSTWRMATIRRRARNISGKIVLGLEKLPAAPQPARIKALTRANWNDWTQVRIGPLDFVPAIFFAARPPMLLIERARHREGHRYLLLVGNERHLVDLNVRKERDPDFVVARVEFMSASLPESAAEEEQMSSGEMMTTVDLTQAPPALN